MVKLKEYFRHLSREHPSRVISKLAVGDVIQRSSNQFYKIDDIGLDEKFGEITDDVSAYKKIYNYFKSNKDDVTNLFENTDDNSTIPFSKVVKGKKGVCLEKAIIGQMNFQRRKKESFVISGFLTVNDLCEKHAFNVVLEDAGAYLHDISNPSRNPSTGKKIPYIIPIENIEGNFKKISVPKKLSQNRVYSIF